MKKKKKRKKKTTARAIAAKDDDNEWQLSFQNGLSYNGNTSVNELLFC